MGSDYIVEALVDLVYSFKDTALAVVPLPTFIKSFLPDFHHTNVPDFKLRQEDGDDDSEEEFESQAVRVIYLLAISRDTQY